MKKTTAHVEQPGFTSDRVLMNEILVLMEVGSWIEAEYAIPDGNVARLHEVFKVSLILL